MYRSQEKKIISPYLTLPPHKKQCTARVLYIPYMTPGARNIYKSSSETAHGVPPFVQDLGVCGFLYQLEEHQVKCNLFDVGFLTKSGYSQHYFRIIHST